MGSLRLPRFKRSHAIAPLDLTERDREILAQVNRHKFLRSDHISALCNGSSQQISRRLQRLFHHGFLDRPKCQIDYYQTGSRRIAYGIGKKGLDLLRREYPNLFPVPITKNYKFIGRLFLEHALFVSDIVVAVELACRQRGDVRFLLGADSGEFVPSQWNVTVDRGLKCQLIPDCVFGLEYAREQRWYFLEADRGTMPVTRRSLQRSSIRRKFECYAATWAQKIHQEFGIRRFRVLTVTTKPERVENMIRTCRNNVKAGQGLFLFTTLESLKEQADFWAPFWKTAYPDTPASLLN
jgi:DNA-binding Lrp family transcriptional regulator